MSIKITFDLAKKECKLDTNIEPGDESTQIQVAVEGASGVEINHLKFGYNLLLNDSAVSSVTFPEVGKIDTVKEGTVLYENVHIEPNTTYSLQAWSENGGERIDNEFTVTTPIPPQPYPSWTWNGSEWVSPVPVPTDGPADASYKWSEKQQKWFHLVPPLHHYDDI
jgi:hypothetical protein